MCGIWGFVTEERSRGDANRLRFIVQSAIAGSFRGSDSTGAFAVPHTGSFVNWVKKLGPGWELLEDKVWRERFMASTMSQYRAIVGHNRAATNGAISVDNAHPFQEGPITLVHNGTLHSTMGMPIPKAKLAAQNVEVDSHVICHNLQHHSVEEVVASLEGAYALVWHDKRDDSINLIRNTSRPLYLMRPVCESTVMFASEPDMLWWLSGRNSFTRAPMYQPDPGVLVRFTRKGGIKPELRRLETFQYTTHYSKSGTGYGDADWGWSAGTQSWQGGDASSRSYGRRHYPGLPNLNKTGAEATSQATAASGATPTQVVGAALGKGRVQIGNKSYPIPAAHLDALTRLEIPQDVPLEFLVETATPTYGTPYAKLNGFLYWYPKNNKNLTIQTSQALALQVPERYAETAVKTTIMVQAIGTTLLGKPGQNQHVAVLVLPLEQSGDSCKESSKRSSAQGSISDAVRTVMPQREALLAPLMDVPGPANAMISAGRWIQLTADGCIQCGRAISIKQAADVVWVNSNQDPLCPDCVQDYSQNHSVN